MEKTIKEIELSNDFNKRLANVLNYDGDIKLETNGSRTYGKEGKSTKTAGYSTYNDLVKYLKAICKANDVYYGLTHEFDESEPSETKKTKIIFKVCIYDTKSDNGKRIYTTALNADLVLGGAITNLDTAINWAIVNTYTTRQVLSKAFNVSLQNDIVDEKISEKEEALIDLSSKGKVIKVDESKKEEIKIDSKNNDPVENKSSKKEEKKTTKLEEAIAQSEVKKEEPKAQEVKKPYVVGEAMELSLKTNKEEKEYSRDEQNILDVF